MVYWYQWKRRLAVRHSGKTMRKMVRVINMVRVGDSGERRL